MYTHVCVCKYIRYMHLADRILTSMCVHVYVCICKCVSIYVYMLYKFGEQNEKIQCVYICM